MRKASGASKPIAGVPPALTTGAASGAPLASKVPKVDTKTLPPTKSLRDTYEAEKQKIMRVLEEHMRQQDIGGQQWAREALRSLEANYERLVQAGTLRDQFQAFRDSQRYGWG